MDGNKELKESVVQDTFKVLNQNIQSLNLILKHSDLTHTQRELLESLVTINGKQYGNLKMALKL